MTTGKIEVQVFEVLNQVGQGLALRPVIRVFLEIPQPPLAFLPMDVFDRVHRAFLFCRNELVEQTHGILDGKDIEEHGISSLPIRNPTSIRNNVTNLGKHIR